MNKEVCKEVRDDWRKQAEGAMHSAVWEYCPKDEFFALLDYIDELEKTLTKTKDTLQYISERGDKIGVTQLHLGEVAKNRLKESF